jgi:hypothetical protein
MFRAATIPPHGSRPDGRVALGPDNIQIKNISPVLIDTDMARDDLDRGKAYAPFVARTSLGRRSVRRRGVTID